MVVFENDYYAAGSKELAIETALTVQRLEPVRAFCCSGYGMNLAMYLSFIKCTIRWNPAVPLIQLLVTRLTRSSISLLDAHASINLSMADFLSHRHHLLTSHFYREEN